MQNMTVYVASPKKSTHRKTLEPTSELKILQNSIVFINTKNKSKNDTSVASKDLQNDTYNSVKIVKQGYINKICARHVH